MVIETETVERASRELCSTQEPTVDVSIVQPIERGDGGVSFPQEHTGRTSQALCPKEVIILHQNLEAKLQNIDDLQVANTKLRDDLLSFQKKKFEDANVSQTKRRSIYEVRSCYNEVFISCLH